MATFETEHIELPKDEASTDGVKNGIVEDGKGDEK